MFSVLKSLIATDIQLGDEETQSNHDEASLRAPRSWTPSDVDNHHAEIPVAEPAPESVKDEANDSWNSLSFPASKSKKAKMINKYAYE